MKLVIDHVYGYRTSDCQQNVRYNSNSSAVYFVAALGVVHNPLENKQEIYGG